MQYLESVSTTRTARFGLCGVSPKSFGGVLGYAGIYATTPDYLIIDADGPVVFQDPLLWTIV